MTEPIKEDFKHAGDEGGRDPSNLITHGWLNAVGAFVNTGHAEATAAQIAAHVESATPHPAYDDMPDLTLIYENGLI